MADKLAHQWRETVGYCVCCWSVCDVCRLCRCQDKTRKLHGACPGRDVRYA